MVSEGGYEAIATESWKATESTQEAQSRTRLLELEQEEVKAKKTALAHKALALVTGLPAVIAPIMATAYSLDNDPLQARNHALATVLFFAGAIPSFKAMNRAHRRETRATREIITLQKEATNRPYLTDAYSSKYAFHIDNEA